MIYETTGDIIAIAIGCMLLIVLQTTYTKHTTRFKLICFASLQIIFCSAVSIFLNRSIIPVLNSSSESFLRYLGYTLYSIKYAILGNLQVMTFFYMCELLHIGSKRVTQVLNIVSIIYYVTLATFSPIFMQITPSGVRYITPIVYIVYSVILIVLDFCIMTHKKTPIVKKILLTMMITYIEWAIMVVVSCVKCITTYTTIAYLIPLIMMVILFHSVSYDADYLTLGRDSLKIKLSNLLEQNNSFKIIYIEIPNFTHVEDKSEIMQGFQNLIKDLKQQDFGYRYHDDVFIFFVKEGTDISALKSFMNVFPTRSILVVSRNNHFTELKDYIEYIHYLQSKHEDVHYYEEQVDDYNSYCKYNFIKRDFKRKSMVLSLEDDSIEVYCQPILDLKTNKFTTAESLMRYRSPEFGLTFPDFFIPIAEETGTIHSLSLILLNKVCKYLSEHKDLKRMSVNFSMVEIVKPEFIDDIVTVISQYDIDYSRIGFEVTESIEAENYNTIMGVFNQLKLLGIPIYLDDFGTGYSNIERIIQLPIDIIKFDKSLVRSSSEDSESQYMVEHLSNMFNSLGYSVLYEGIENEEDQNRCVKMDAEYLQGYKYSKPIPLSELEDFLKKHNAEV